MMGSIHFTPENPIITHFGLMDTVCVVEGSGDMRSVGLNWNRLVRKIETF